MARGLLQRKTWELQDVRYRGIELSELEEGLKQWKKLTLQEVYVNVQGGLRVKRCFNDEDTEVARGARWLLRASCST